MNIKFKEIEKQTGKKANGDAWEAFVIHGTKMEDNTDWSSTKIFDNRYNEEILGKLEGLEPGDAINVVHKKNKAGYWVVSDITEPKEESRPKSNSSPRSSGAGGSSGSGKGKGDTMSKEEWAAKNEVDRIRIAKSVALKAAIEHSKAGTKAETVVALAQEFMPFLTDDKIEPFVGGGDDGLDAPEVE